MPRCRDNPASALQALRAQLVEHITPRRTRDRRRQLLQNLEQVALSTDGPPVRHDPVYRCAASWRRRELRDLLTAISDQKRLSMPRPLGVAAQVLAHLADTNELHVRHCGAL